MNLILVVTLSLCFEKIRGDNHDALPLLYRHRRVINGRRSSSKEFPFIVALHAHKKYNMNNLQQSTGEIFCGGTWISHQWVVTAAHCLYSKMPDGRRISYDDPKYWRIRLLSNSLIPKYRRSRDSHILEFYGVSKIIRHPQFKDSNLENDIALFKIKESLSLAITKRNPSVHFMNRKPNRFDKCVVAGWGCGRIDGPPSLYLKKLHLPILTAKECDRIFNYELKINAEKEICAGYHNQNKGICTGDSGGPLACYDNGKYVLAGILSAGHFKDPQSYPAIFTRVAYFKKWIDDNTKL